MSTTVAMHAQMATMETQLAELKKAMKEQKKAEKSANAQQQLDMELDDTECSDDVVEPVAKKPVTTMTKEDKKKAAQEKKTKQAELAELKAKVRELSKEINPKKKESSAYYCIHFKADGEQCHSKITKGEFCHHHNTPEKCVHKVVVKPASYYCAHTKDDGTPVPLEAHQGQVVSSP